MIGIGTALADDPMLTCRLPGMSENSPVRVVLDTALRLPVASRLVQTARQMPVWVVAGHGAPAAAANALRSHARRDSSLGRSRRQARSCGDAENSRRARHDPADGRRRSDACLGACWRPILSTRRSCSIPPSIVGRRRHRRAGCGRRGGAGTAAEAALQANPSGPIGRTATSVGTRMFTGIISDLGEVLEVHEKAEGLRRLVIACSYDPEFHRYRRLDRLFGRLPDGGRPRRDGKPDLFQCRRRGRNAAA